MPPAVPLVAAAAGAAASAAIGTGLLASLGGAVVATGLNFLGSRALAKKPKSPQFNADASGRITMVRSSVESHKIVYGQARVSGPIVFIKTVNTGINSALQAVSGDNKFLHMVVALAGHEVQEIGQIYLNDRPVTLDGQGFVIESPYFDGGFSYVRITKHQGSADQAADPNLISECGWTADHRLRGIAYLYLRMEWKPDAFPVGIPNVSAVVKGRKVYDPRTDATAYSTNPALCIRDYLTADHGFGCGPDEIDDAYFIAGANLCDESVATTNGGVQARYTCNGVADTSTAPLDNLSAMLTSVAGAVTYVQGAFRLHAAAYDSPAGDIGTGILLGGVKLDARPSRKELFNAVKGTYVDPSKQWQPTDFPPVTNATYAAEDGGEQIFKDVELPFTTDPERAQRLAKIILEKGRQGIRVTLPVDHTALQYSVYDVVTLTNAQLGWNAKPFRILKWSLRPPGPITLSLQEESSASYDWNSGEAAAIDAAPDTTLPNPFVVAPPGALTVEESAYVTRSGDGVKAKATLTWGASPDVFARQYQAEFKLTSADAWTLLPRTEAATQEIEDIAPGSYHFRVKALNHLNVSSPYSTSARQISGLLDPPTAPQNLTINSIGGLALLRWDISPDLDVKIGGRFVFRHSPNAAATWSESTTIGNAVPGTATSVTLPLKAGVYLVKAVDSSGVQSTSAASVPADQATALAYASVTSMTESPTFSGTKTGVVVDSGTLKLSGSGQFDGIPDFDAVPDLDAYGGINTDGTYQFAAAMDLATVKRVRLTGTVEATISQPFDKIDSRIAEIDDWEFFDGAEAAEADALLYVRQTDDDPAGTPAWKPWHRLDASEFEARAFQYKLEMVAHDATYNIAVSTLSVAAEEVT